MSLFYSLTYYNMLQEPVFIGLGNYTKLFFSDFEKKTVMLRDKIISLTEGEWRVLACLAKRHGEPVSRAELSLLFGAEKGNISDVYICRLRKKLEEPLGIKIINTVREKGYALSIKADNIPV